MRPFFLLAAIVAAAPLPAVAAEPITVTVTNLVTGNGIAYAPIRVGFGNGTFDAFTEGQAAGAPIVSIAEGGSGADWFPAFAAADPNAVLGTVGGVLMPGMSASALFMLDVTANRYFTFAGMVIPSNDVFVGNDLPDEYRIFNDDGTLAITELIVFASEIWDAGSERFAPGNADFIVGGNNDARIAEGGVVTRDFAGLSGFNGLQTAGGYTFQNGLSANDAVLRISFSQTAAVPEPATWAMMLLGFGAIGASMRRARTRTAPAIA